MQMLLQLDMLADVITAALLIGVCMDEHLDLSKVKLNSEAAIGWMHNFLSLKEVELNDKIFDLCTRSGRFMNFIVFP